MDETSIRINHSCDANVGFRGQVLYVAMRDIAIDGETLPRLRQGPGPMTPRLKVRLWDGGLPGAR
ncbi:MAG: hypothetical protein CM1200mP26_13540 [Acidimicrobiales bacterium]|nr:MAG: hypothetical protein CM1200mP26_13540 [Acidimicrobiales bacterium]